MAIVTLVGSITVPPANLAAVRQALPDHIAATLAEVGCLVFRVAEDPAQPGRFNVYEEFQDPDAFDFHQARVRSSRWSEITKNAQRDYRIVGCDQ